MSPANLHIVFLKPGSSTQKLLEGSSTLQWSTPKNAKPGDVALLYVGGQHHLAIFGIGVVAAHPTQGRSTPGRRGYFTRYENVQTLNTPLALSTIRLAFSQWKRWSNLSGVSVHTVPNGIRTPLAKTIVRDTPAARWVLRPWLRGNAQAPKLYEDGLEQARYEGSQITRRQIVYERDERSRKVALANARPPYTCVVCGFNFEKAYGLAGRGCIEVHHTNPVSLGPRVARAKDLSVLCSNCHSMAHWHSGKQPRSIATLKKLWKSSGLRSLEGTQQSGR